MGLNQNISSALQRHINPEYETAETLYTSEFDIHCDAAVTSGLNAKSENCAIRLSQREVPKVCRMCRGIKEKPIEVPKLAMKADSRSHKLKPLCECGSPKSYNKTLCNDCRETRRRKLQKAYKAKKRDEAAELRGVNKCKCGTVLANNKLKYCDPCRVAVRIQTQATHNENKRKQRQLA